MDYQELQRQTSEKLQELVDLIGPRDCEHGAFVDCERECEYGDTWSRDSQMLMHSVLITSWADMKSEGMAGSVTIVSGHNQPDYVTSGLLHEAVSWTS